MEVWWSVTLPLTDTLTRRTANAETTQCAVGGEPSSIYQVLDARGRVYRGTPALPTTKSVPRTAGVVHWSRSDRERNSVADPQFRG
jgi:hypothetical protein